MKRNFKTILVGLTAVCMCGVLTGCGKETIDITVGADVSVTGYDGQGTAMIAKSNILYKVANQYGKDMSIMDRAELEDRLASAVEYSLSEDTGLSNGDEITLTIEVDESAFDDYDFKLVGGEKKITVKGLDEVETIDPFADAGVTFSGMSPNGVASINTSSSYNELSLNYKLDKNTGLKNGDEVTLSVSSYNGTDVEEYCASRGKALSATEKKFTVEGLASYAQTIADIPDDMKNKMLAQAEDAIKAKCIWDKKGTTGILKSLEYLGDYYLTGKEGFDTSPYNKIYCVYKGTVEFNALKKGGDGKTNEIGTASFYTYYYYDNIIIMPDNTCSLNLSDGRLADYSYTTDYGYSDWGMNYYSLHGKEDLDSMFNDCVTSKIANYNYESTVKE
ncbi:MAG: hypothetical protein K2J08_12700 [Ruminococcus sp.]|nr:hypothetical protein [Ruminococcus sp.]